MSKNKSFEPILIFTELLKYLTIILVINSFDERCVQSFPVFKPIVTNNRTLNVIDFSRKTRRHYRLSPLSSAFDSTPDYTDSQLKIVGFRAEADAKQQWIDSGTGLTTLKADAKVDFRVFGHSLNSTEFSIGLTTDPPSVDSTAHCSPQEDKHFTAEGLDSNTAIVSIQVLDEGRYYVCYSQTTSARLGSVWVYVDGAHHEYNQIGVEGPFIPFWIQIVLIVLLLAMSGLFSGLNLGLMSLDKNELKVIERCGTPQEKAYAKQIAPVRRRGNYLLCTLLLGNVLVNSTLTILLDELTSGIVAVIASTLSIVVFGEIIPQALCSRHGLAVGARTVWITYLFMVLTLPLSYPISKILDKILGEEIGNVYDRERLMEYIRVTKDYNRLDPDEVNIISGALKLSKIRVVDIMTHINDVFMLSYDSSLNGETIVNITDTGYSRIPVFEGDRNNVVGILHAKDLALTDPDDDMPVKQLIEIYKHPLYFVYEDVTLDVMLNEFKQGKSHMAFVRRIIDNGENDPYYELAGVVTLEDVIEELIQAEINDETDIISDNRRKQKRSLSNRPNYLDLVNFNRVNDAETE